MIYKIKPTDTLFFRTGRPFSMGDETWSDTIFPPYSSTFYGALRTFIIFNREGLQAFKEGRYMNDIGSPESKGGMRIYGPFLYKDTTLYFPVPLDLVEVKESTKRKLLPLEFTDTSEIFISNYSFEKILVYKGDLDVDEPEGFLDEISLKDYLLGKTESLYRKEPFEFYKTELKIGISREKNTLTSKEGYLYRIPLIRLNENTSFIIELENIEDIPKEGLLQLGGEGKVALLEEVNSDLLDNLKNLKLNLENGYFKLYLVTPSIFNNGFLPSWIDKKSLEGEKDGIKVKLVAVAVGKPLKIGGWDLARQEPKPMYNAVPAGSIYYFRIIGNYPFEKIKESFHFKNISDINPEEGFGLSLVGKVIV
ncbi:type III-B CRISPR module-associated protein Cmr3 [bacterium]|nr:type III-B CRISPR module-associated protein Cmr3 [bacterium]